MPPRDDADYENKRQQIIDGALRVFATKGYENATNKDIAQAAGIGSPGLIYHYFKDKMDLFEQVLAQRATVLQLLNRSEELMNRPPREVLPMFAQTFVQMLGNRASVAVFKVMMAESIRHQGMLQPVLVALPGGLGVGGG